MSASGSGDKLTPYQGRRRTFGEFRCPQCSRQWQSGNSWANIGQQCESCKIMVYPHSQKPLEKSAEKSKIDLSKHHPQELCGKCQSLGRPCSSKAFNKKPSSY